jgi:hypothetical protein
MSHAAPYLRSALAFCVAAGTLAACSSRSDEVTSEPSPAAASTGATNTNAPLKPEQVNVVVKVSSGPTYDPVADQVHVAVSLLNNGNVTLPVTGTNPVTMGIVQKLPNVSGLPDKRGEESRAAFTAPVAPSSSAEVQVVLPATFVVGNKVEFDALQEGIAWFGFSYSQPTAVIGPFARCVGGSGICDDQGRPLITR